MKGTLYLVPAPLHKEDGSWLLPGELAGISHLKNWVVEHPKTAREFIKRLSLETPLQELEMFSLQHDKAPESIKEAKALLEKGVDVGLMSEAGCPGVADPGALMVEAAHRAGANIRPLVGPSSILLALMASGSNGQQFKFNGYLEKDKSKLGEALARLEKEAMKGVSEIFIETPYNNDRMLEEMCGRLSPGTEVFLGINITHPEEKLMRMSVAELKKKVAAGFKIGKIPTIFVICAKAAT